MPGGKDVGKNISELEKANANRPPGKKRKRAQIVAIALKQAKGK